MKFQKSKKFTPAAIVIVILTLLLLISVTLNATSFAGMYTDKSRSNLNEREALTVLVTASEYIDWIIDIRENRSENFNEREALTVLVTSSEYIDWIIDIRENRSENFPVISYFGLENGEYVFSLRENNGVINANHGFYFINSNSGEIRSQFK